MTPMIDVVFLLIVFFLVSSHLARQESQLPLPLPEAVSGQESNTQRQRIVVNILEDGALMLAGRKIAANELLSRLRYERTQQGEDLEVRIRGDRGAPFQFIQPVLLAVSNSGISNVTFSVVQRP